MTEDWKYVTGFEGRYQISNFGRIRSFCRPKQRILKLHNDRHGYPSASLKKDNKMKHLLIHRLVATHFIENPLNKPEVNHKDFNRTNNRIDNLEWCTGNENREHARMRPGRVFKPKPRKVGMRIKGVQVIKEKILRTKILFKKVNEKNGSYWYGIWIGRALLKSWGMDFEKAEEMYKNLIQSKNKIVNNILLNPKKYYNEKEFNS